MKLFVLVLLSLSLTSCSKISIQSYADTQPELDLREFFDGKLRVYGMLQNRRGEVTRKFTADIDASWQDNRGILDERFVFDDGEKTTRVWQLEYLGEGQYVGTAGDVVGTASGQARGFAFNWRYTLEIPYQGDSIEIKLDDWLYLISEKRLLNRTELTKFGFRVGELTLVIEKL